MKHFILLTGFVVAALALAQTKDTKITKLDNGYVRVEANGFSMELPEGWVVGKETPWGARDIKSKDAVGKLGTMTANAQTATWDSLYRTSLYFILREEKGTPTEYKEIKTKKGYEAISFQVKNSEGFTNRRYVLVKNTDGRALALSVNIGKPAEEAMMIRAFERMVDTATFVKAP